MAKRKRLSSEEEYDAETPSSDNEEMQGKRARASRTRSRSTKKKGAKGVSSPSSSAILSAFDASSGHSKSLHVISAVPAIRTALLKWYATVHASRGMPWRKPYDPNLGEEERAQRAYEVWVSEIMLQQTQVATVIPYYNAWMKKFPTIRHLAASPLDDVNALWKGLGYYSRASRLLAGAQKAVKDYDGRLPDNAKEMEANIPGIGRYSAGAICSIAYGERVPVLDGNVHRLLSRLLALYASPKAKATLDVLWAAAAAMVQEPNGSITLSGRSQPQETRQGLTEYPGDINQALIELGNTICNRDPSCEVCPLQSWCAAYAGKHENKELPDLEDMCTLCEPLPAGSDVTVYPMKVEKKKIREELDVVSVVEWRSTVNLDDRRFLLIRRPNKGLLAGLYEFPTESNVSTPITKATLKELPFQQLTTLLRDPVEPYMARKLKRTETSRGYRIVNITSAGDVLHVFSHIKKTYRVQWVVLDGEEEPPQLVASSKSTSSAAGSAHDTSMHTSADNSADMLWKPLEEVAHANIGTGVSKIWNLVASLWENSPA